MTTNLPSPCKLSVTFRFRQSFDRHVALTPKTSKIFTITTITKIMFISRTEVWQHLTTASLDLM